MRILHTADWHLGKKLDFYSRVEEQKVVLQEIVAIANEKAVDMVIVAGDLFDNFTPSNESMELLYKTLNRLTRKGQVPVIAIAGNHDSPDRINVPDVLARESGIIFIGNPTDVVPLFSTEDGFKVVKTDVGFVEIELPKYDYPVRVLHIAFANELRLKEYFGEDKQSSLQDSLSSKWNDLAEKYCDQNGVNVLTTHLFMQKRGGEVLEEPDGEKPLKIGNADVIYSDAIPASVQYAALGHLHGYRNVGSNQPVIYSSSLLRYSFSEANQEKYVAIIDLEPGKAPEIERVPISGGKPLLRRSFDNTLEAVEWLTENQDALVELTIVSDSFMTAQEQKDIRQAHGGIIHLIPQVRNAGNNDLEKKEINLSEDMNVLFQQYFQSKNNGQEPNEELMSLFNEILNA